MAVLHVRLALRHMDVAERAANDGLHRRRLWWSTASAHRGVVHLPEHDRERREEEEEEDLAQSRRRQREGTKL